MIREEVIRDEGEVVLKWNIGWNWILERIRILHIVMILSSASN